MSHSTGHRPKECEDVWGTGVEWCWRTAISRAGSFATGSSVVCRNLIHCALDASSSILHGSTGELSPAHIHPRGCVTLVNSLISIITNSAYRNVLIHRLILWTDRRWMIFCLVTVVFRVITVFKVVYVFVCILNSCAQRRHVSMCGPLP